MTGTEPEAKREIISMNQCPRCAQRTDLDDFEDEQPQCAFKSGAFVTDNWHCLTMNALRHLIEEKGQTIYALDQRLGVYPIDEAGRYLVMTWYKQRGRTEMAVIFDSEIEPGPVTLAQAELILAGKGLPLDDGDDSNELADALSPPRAV